MKQNFYEKVYEVVSKIPKGRVTTYGAIAEFAGSRGSARMVGWALNKSKSWPINLPAHRVVNRNGLLTGKHHFGGEFIMSELLANEGVEINGNKVMNFADYFWMPSDTIY